MSAGADGVGAAGMGTSSTESALAITFSGRQRQLASPASRWPAYEYVHVLLKRLRSPSASPMTSPRSKNKIKGHCGLHRLVETQRRPTPLSEPTDEPIRRDPQVELRRDPNAL